MAETIRAESDRRYYLRFLLIGLVAAGFGLWALYDGYIAYPNQRERALKYEELEANFDEWKAYAAERGWSDDPPGAPKTDADIVMQYVMAAVAGSIGLLMLFGVWWSRGGWIEADHEQLKSSWGGGFKYADVVSLDKRRWKNKGIAVVRYDDGQRKGRFVIDDFKFHREPTDQILVRLESQIDPDKITGGLPEEVE